MIILRGVNVFPTQIEEQVMATDGLAPYFQIELLNDGRMDSMQVLVEPAPGANVSGADAVLTKRIKDIVGVSTRVVLGEAGSVARSQGKAVRVVDKRSKG